MDTIQITLPDGSSRQAPRGITPAEIARQISPRLAEEALVARVSSSNPPSAGAASGATSDGELVDLSRPLDRDARLTLLPAKDPAALQVLHHYAAHLQAAPVRQHAPHVEEATGPAS